MNWRNEAKNDLRELRALEVFVNTYSVQIEELDAQLTAVRGANLSRDPVSGGGGTKLEDKWLDVIAKKERLSWHYEAKHRKLMRIKKSLNLLSDEEKMVLEVFYVDTVSNHIESLKRRLNVEKSTIYRIHDDGLKLFTIGMYGGTED